MTEEADRKLEQFRGIWEGLTGQIGRVIVGHREVVEQVLICLFGGGHALLEGVPGIGKTLLVRTLARCLGLEFTRIQFTPDLMPADITGTNVLMEDEKGRRSFSFQKGPVFGNLVLADEINRATPKTQAALLEAMQEHFVTVAGTRHELPEPFFVLATQNPIEMEGTYPLPEAQLDRFMFKIELGAPDVKEISEILERTTGSAEPQVERVAEREEVLAMMTLVRDVEVAGEVRDYAARLAVATRADSTEASEAVSKYVRYGSSPRGAQALLMGAKVRALSEGRGHAAFEDVRAIALSSLRHRMILNFEAEAEEVKQDNLVESILESVSQLPPEVESVLPQGGS